MSREDIGYPESPAASVESAFVAIASGTMRDMPLNNPALRVEAVGFSLWEGYWVGVLITPWAINLMLLPSGKQHIHRVGGCGARHLRFPSGLYAFNDGRLDGLGPYRSCSLYSPPAEFLDQDSARAVALAVMDALFRPEAEFESVPAAVSRRAFLRGRFRKVRNVDGVSEP